MKFANSTIKYGLTEHAGIQIQANYKRFNKIIVQKLKLKTLTGANDVHYQLHHPCLSWQQPLFGAAPPCKSDFVVETASNENVSHLFVYQSQPYYKVYTECRTTLYLKKDVNSHQF